MKQILMAINDKIYDVTKYIPKHPGEGIKNSYLKNFDRKDVTNLFDKFHLTNEPDELLEKSINNENEFIFYVSPFFKFYKFNKIPKYYYFIREKHEIDILLETNKYILYYFENMLKLSYKNNDNEICNHTIKSVNDEYILVKNKIIFKSEFIDNLIKDFFKE